MVYSSQFHLMSYRVLAQAHVAELSIHSHPSSPSLTIVVTSPCTVAFFIDKQNTPTPHPCPFSLLIPLSLPRHYDQKQQLSNVNISPRHLKMPGNQSPILSSREMEVLALAWQCMEQQPKVPNPHGTLPKSNFIPPN